MIRILFVFALYVIQSAAAVRMQTRESVVKFTPPTIEESVVDYTPPFGTDTDMYVETDEKCRLYSGTVLHLYSMTSNESHAVWASTTPTTEIILRNAMTDIAENIGVLAKMTYCDMSVFEP